MVATATLVQILQLVPKSMQKPVLQLLWPRLLDRKLYEREFSQHQFSEGFMTNTVSDTVFCLSWPSKSVIQFFGVRSSCRFDLRVIQSNKGLIPKVHWCMLQGFWENHSCIKYVSVWRQNLPLLTPYPRFAISPDLAPFPQHQLALDSTFYHLMCKKVWKWLFMHRGRCFLNDSMQTLSY